MTVSEMEEFEYEEGDQEVVEDAVARIELLGLDPEQVERTMLGRMATGEHPVDALEAAVEAHDHSEDADELAALERISTREGWS